jgi:hypothetical protein
MSRPRKDGEKDHPRNREFAIMAYLVIEVKNANQKLYVSRLEEYKLVAKEKGRVTVEFTKEVMFRDEEQAWNVYNKIVASDTIPGEVTLLKFTNEGWQVEDKCELEESITA